MCIYQEETQYGILGYIWAESLEEDKKNMDDGPTQLWQGKNTGSYDNKRI